MFTLVLEDIFTGGTPHSLKSSGDFDRDRILTSYRGFFGTIHLLFHSEIAYKHSTYIYTFPCFLLLPDSPNSLPISAIQTISQSKRAYSSCLPPPPLVVHSPTLFAPHICANHASLFKHKRPQPSCLHASFITPLESHHSTLYALRIPNSPRTTHLTVLRCRSSRSKARAGATKRTYDTQAPNGSDFNYRHPFCVGPRHSITVPKQCDINYRAKPKAARKRGIEKKKEEKEKRKKEKNLSAWHRFPTSTHFESEQVKCPQNMTMYQRNQASFF